MINPMDNPLHKEFVSPGLCILLDRTGLKVSTCYFWKYYKEAVLCSYSFDPDSYYKDSDLQLDAMYPPTFKTAALQLGDLNKLLPDYYISRTNNEFTIGIEQHYGVPFIADKRLPDLFAKLVLKMIEMRILSVEKCVAILTEKTT